MTRTASPRRGESRMPRFVSVSPSQKLVADPVPESDNEEVSAVTDCRATAQLSAHPTARLVGTRRLPTRGRCREKTAATTPTRPALTSKLVECTCSGITARAPRQCTASAYAQTALDGI